MNQKLSSRQRAQEIARLALDKKAYDVVILEVGPLVFYTDYFVICTADNSIQAQAIADNVEGGMKKDHKLTPIGIEGHQNAQWVLLDFDSVVVHVFEKETRQRYELSKLWLDAAEVPVEEAKTKAPVGGQD